MKRKPRSTNFKKKIALEAIQEKKTIAEIMVRPKVWTANREE